MLTFLGSVIKVPVHISHLVAGNSTTGYALGGTAYWLPNPQFIQGQGEKNTPISYKGLGVRVVLKERELLGRVLEPLPKTNRSENPIYKG